MSNLDFCAVDRVTGWCEKCCTFVADEGLCAELQELYDSVDDDEGDFNIE